MKLHPLSGLSNAVRYGVSVGSFGFFVGMMGLLADTQAWFPFVLAPLGFLVGVVYGVAYYYLFEYELTEETFDVTSGVVNRQHREIPYHRIQNIDVTESLLKRLLGLAVLRVETAGGGSTEATLDSVSQAEADRLQTVVRERKRAAAESAAAESEREHAPSQSDQESEPTLLFELSPTELAVLAGAFLRPGALFLVVFGIPLADDLAVRLLLSLARPLGGPTQITHPSADSVLILALVGVPLLVVCAWAASALLTIIEYFGFELGRISGDLVYQRGLFRRYSGTIPLEKIQLLTVKQSVLSRPLGYAGLAVETAGYAGEQSRGHESETAIPLSDRERVFELARAIEPFGELTFSRLPKRARRRYAVRYLLVVIGLVAGGFLLSRFARDFTLWYLPAVALPLVPIAAHYKWKHRGYHVGERYIAIRTGYWRQTTKIIPYYRLQTVFTSQSIFQRRLALATLTADTASSSTLGGRDPSVYDIDAATAARLQTLLRERLQEALRARR